ncbi:MAG TPA: thioredoxin domain-containing protein [Candidatus Dormibacteraeota bacterium]|nr:thioredoxin domain-containing protein [Candidatus Dormibacteraeota bacterium]
MTRRTPTPPTSRRTRRAAQRTARQAARERELARSRGGWNLPGSPLVWLSVAGVAVAAVIVGVLLFVNRPANAQAINAPILTSPPELVSGRTLGKADAPVTIDVWADFQCPGCGQFTRLVAPQIVDNYVTPGKAKIVYHDYAFLGQESVDAAVAARCAEQQGKFWAYHDYLFANQSGENQGAFSRDRLLQIAAAVDLDKTAFTSCLDDPATLQAVQAETQQGYQQGITGTPTIYVNGVKQDSYDYPTVSASIDAALGTGSPSPSTSGATPTPSPSPTPAGSPTPSGS